jgi:argininosuccinate lyase
MELSLDEWQALGEHFDDEVLSVVTVDSSVAARKSYGGTAPDQVREQLKRARELQG